MGRPWFVGSVAPGFALAYDEGGILNADRGGALERTSAKMSDIDLGPDSSVTAASPGGCTWRSRITYGPSVARLKEGLVVTLFDALFRLGRAEATTRSLSMLRGVRRRHCMRPCECARLLINRREIRFGKPTGVELWRLGPVLLLLL